MSRKLLSLPVAIQDASSEIEAKAAAAIRVELERKGTPIGHYAVLIAGTAFHHNEVLVTNNTNEFKRI